MIEIEILFIIDRLILITFAWFLIYNIYYNYVHKHIAIIPIYLGEVKSYTCYVVCEQPCLYI